jgi:hypothetical protein
MDESTTEARNAKVEAPAAAGTSLKTQASRSGLLSKHEDPFAYFCFKTREDPDRVVVGGCCLSRAGETISTQSFVHGRRCYILMMY